ncbi:beta-glucanase [Streptomyces sp. NPDC127051]|uniref:glycoside hydrolase family 16 protein n=1 Tax=Streptomyces sp. NPDC127051 TaxID=3347119 RepID=UPI0036510245
MSVSWRCASMALAIIAYLAFAGAGYAAAPVAVGPAPPQELTGDTSTGIPTTLEGGSAKTLVFAEEFDLISWGSRWSGTRSSAYESDQTNLKDCKLDRLTASAVTVEDGKATFTARPGNDAAENGQQSWTTGLLTTEGTTESFRVRSGDFLEARVKLPEERGAWPALWTWKDGSNEIDVFEYHPDNPDLLELSNGIRSAGLDYRDTNTISPGRWITIGVQFGVDTNDWYLNGKKVYSDLRGVDSTWSAYLILNLSISAGEWHPAPDGAKPISFTTDYLRVWRRSNPVPGEEASERFQW